MKDLQMLEMQPWSLCVPAQPDSLLMKVMSHITVLGKFVP